MKKIIIKILLTVLIIGNIGFISNTYADETEGESEGITVTVTEKIPGAGCIEIEDMNNDGTVKSTKYECEVKKGFGSVISLMGGIIKYFTFIAGLGGVLFIIVNGIMYSMGGAEPSLKDEAKKRIIGTIVGLIVLLLSGVILNTLFPWIYV